MDYYDFVDKPKLTVEYLTDALYVLPKLAKEDSETAHMFQDEIQSMYINKIVKTGKLTPELIKIGKLIQKIMRIKYDKWYS
jgi:hypothetical protein